VLPDSWAVVKWPIQDHDDVVPTSPSIPCFKHHCRILSGYSFVSLSTPGHGFHRACLETGHPTTLITLSWISIILASKVSWPNVMDVLGASIHLPATLLRLYITLCDNADCFLFLEARFQMVFACSCQSAYPFSSPSRSQPHPPTYFPHAFLFISAVRQKILLPSLQPWQASTEMPSVHEPADDDFR
jgi:hypothetical protein